MNGKPVIIVASMVTEKATAEIRKEMNRMQTWHVKITKSFFKRCIRNLPTQVEEYVRNLPTRVEEFGRNLPTRVEEYGSHLPM